jgi:hypothetical protein
MRNSFIICSLVNIDNMDNLDIMVNLDKWFRPRKAGSSIFTNDAFWRVSADTKTCGSPLYLSPTGGLC